VDETPALRVSLDFSPPLFSSQPFSAIESALYAHTVYLWRGISEGTFGFFERSLGKVSGFVLIVPRVCSAAARFTAASAAVPARRPLPQRKPPGHIEPKNFFLSTSKTLT
jgi:hypothetical protein